MEEEASKPKWLCKCGLRHNSGLGTEKSCPACGQSEQDGCLLIMDYMGHQFEVRKGSEVQVD